jgi:acetyltransferase
VSVTPGLMQAAPPALLDALFAPRSIAVVGAGAQSEGMGARYLQMIASYGFSGNLYAVNRSGAPCGDTPGYRRVSDLPETVDLCLIAIPAAGVAAVVSDCADRGVPIAQVFSSGFDDHGAASRRSLLEAARSVTRIVGPNCLGTHSPRGRITFVRDADPAPGSVAIVSQSGGLSTDILHQAQMRGMALSKLVSIGDCLDLGAADFLAYLADDPETTAIGFYLEGGGSPRFFQVLSQAARRKAVVILKGGRTPAGARSAVSHTGALAGDYAIWQAVTAQHGAIEVSSVDEMLAALTALQHGVPLPRGARTALIGNGGGTTVLATDTLSEAGMETASLATATIAEITALGLPAGSSIGSALDLPVGALNKVEPAALRTVFSAILADGGVDVVIAHFNLIPFLNYANAEVLATSLASVLSTIGRSDKPLYAALRGSSDGRVERLRELISRACSQAGVPCFRDATEAARAAALAWHRRCFLSEDAAEAGRVTESLPSDAVRRCREILEQVHVEGRTVLSQLEAFALLDAIGVEHPPVALGRTAAHAADLADTFGFPVALKIESGDILHKSDVGGVRLGVASGAEAARAFEAIVGAARRKVPAARIDGVIVQKMAGRSRHEAIVGIKQDAQFGPVILAGTGGILVELFRDVALRIAPVTLSQARSMWHELRSRPLFEGFRGAKPLDSQAFEKVIVRLSLIAAEFPEIAELDLNPILLWESGLAAVDCRVRIEQGNGHVRSA